MTIRHAVLPLGAVLVLGLGVYLFVEVRAEPAAIAPAVGRAAPPRAVVEPPPPPASEPPPQVAAPPPPPRVPVVTQSPSPPPSLSTSSPPASEPPSGPKLETAMSEANKAYDRGDYDEAKALAGRLLAGDPTNVRMLRIMVSASCLDGDTAVAQAHYPKLPPADQEQMKVRCGRYGITFADKP